MRSDKREKSGKWFCHRPSMDDTGINAFALANFERCAGSD